MKLICEGRCGRGALRQTNQDNLFVNGAWREDISNHEVISFSDVSEEGIYAVCDGMGGESFGEEASLLAVRHLKAVSPQEFYERGPEYLLGMNQDLCHLMRQRHTRIGSTIVALTVSEERVRVINVGDSRAYLLRAGRLTRLSCDHTQTQRLVNMGLLTQEQVATHPDRHKLTQHLGIFPEEMIIEPYVYSLTFLCRGDLFLLCSDGLTDMLSDNDIVRTIQQNTRLKNRTDCLYHAAMQRGGKDNITVLMIQVI